MVDRAKGATEKPIIAENRRKLDPLTRAEIKKKLDKVESEYKKLRLSTEYDRANPGKHAELAALGKSVGDLHRALRRADADLVTIKRVKKALDVAFEKLINDPKFKAHMENILEPYRDLGKYIYKDKGNDLSRM